MNDFLAKYQKEQDDRITVFKENMVLWCKFLTENGIAQVKCEYDGSGDSGQIEDTGFYRQYDAEQQLWDNEVSDLVSQKELDKLKLPDELKQKTWVMKEDGPSQWEIPEGDQQVSVAYEYWACEALPPGFEINDGSFGTLDFNVKEKCMEVVNNARMTHYNTETYEV